MILNLLTIRSMWRVCVLLIVFFCSFHNHTIYAHNLTVGDTVGADHIAYTFAPYRWAFYSGEDIYRDYVSSAPGSGQQYGYIAYEESATPGTSPPSVCTVGQFYKLIRNQTDYLGTLLISTHGGSNLLSIEPFKKDSAGLSARDVRYNAYLSGTTGIPGLPQFTADEIYKSTNDDAYAVGVTAQFITNYGRLTQGLVYVAACYGGSMVDDFVAANARVSAGNHGGASGSEDEARITTFFGRMDGREGQAKRPVSAARAGLPLDSAGEENTTLTPSISIFSKTGGPDTIVAGDTVCFTYDTTCEQIGTADILTNKSVGVTLDNVRWTDNVTLKADVTEITDPGDPVKLVVDWNKSWSDQNTARLDGNTNPPGSNARGPAHDDYIVTLSAKYVDVVLVIDRSGSMYGSKITAAKNAAKMFVDLMQVPDKVGVVSFSSYAGVNYALMRIDSTSGVKAAAKNAINGLYASGMTTIGGGLQTGQNQLTSRGADDPVWVMVLLSDGWENTPPMVSNVLPGIVGTKTRVYTIGLGSGADEALLNTTALVTGGFYRFSPSSAELAAIYQDIQTAVGGLQGIASYISNILQGATQAFDVGIDESILRAVFTATIGGSDIDLVLVKPDGTVINPSVAASDPNITFTFGDSYESYTVVSPMHGNWQMLVTGTDVDPGGEPISVSASGSSNLTLSLDFDKIEYISGEPILVTAELQDSVGPIIGASVVADVQTPSTTDILTLYDDGIHGDGAPDDGVYANSFAYTIQKGSYTFKVDASGDSNTEYPFTRTATKTTVVGQDSDGDGMPDVWEDIYGLNKYSDDSAQDPDGDGLTNLQEYQHRTHPKNSDTDGDGYSDGEEVQAGSDPLDSNSIPDSYPPTSEAGPDQTVEAGYNCIASIALDGSLSYDPEGDPLTYTWTWDSGSATGVNPTIQLPLGTTTITLVVNDGTVDSDPDTVDITVADTMPPHVEVNLPEPDTALQDEITLTAGATDECGIAEVYFCVREPGGEHGIVIGYEDLPGTLNASGEWECDFDTTQLQDGYYVVIAKAIDTNGSEGRSELMPVSIRNWAVIELLPNTANNKAGRTMPVKFALRIAAAVDLAQPFVYNEELEIRIYDKSAPDTILQTSLYGGDASTDYRIDTAEELYITNFKTSKKPAQYVVEIWRMSKNFLVGSFTFETVK